jgi:hypothetical protein
VREGRNGRRREGGSDSKPPAEHALKGRGSLSPVAIPSTSSTPVSAALPALIADRALELAPVRINLVAAGFVDRPSRASLLGDDLEKRRDQLRDGLSSGRVL